MASPLYSIGSFSFSPSTNQHRQRPATAGSDRHGCSLRASITLPSSSRSGTSTLQQRQQQQQQRVRPSTARPSLGSSVSPAAVVQPPLAFGEASLAMRPISPGAIAPGGLTLGSSTGVADGSSRRTSPPKLQSATRPGSAYSSSGPFLTELPSTPRGVLASYAQSKSAAAHLSLY